MLPSILCGSYAYSDNQASESTSLFEDRFWNELLYLADPGIVAQFLCFYFKFTECYQALLHKLRSARSLWAAWIFDRNLSIFVRKHSAQFSKPFNGGIFDLKIKLIWMYNDYKNPHTIYFAVLFCFAKIAKPPKAVDSVTFCMFHVFLKLLLCRCAGPESIKLRCQPRGMFNCAPKLHALTSPRLSGSTRRAALSDLLARFEKAASKAASTVLNLFSDGGRDTDRYIDR